MSARSVVTLLRFPFGLFLSPIALFALVAVTPLDPTRVFLILVTLHCFIYPASNGLNSFYDRDISSIGGLRNPPVPTKGLLRASLILDAIGVLLGILVSPWYALGLLVYGLFSKAYSWDKLRFKRFPIASLLMIAFGQGSLVFLLTAWFGSATPVLPAFLGHNATAPLIQSGAAVTAFLGPVGVLFSPKLLLGAALAACFLLFIYPLTQVYQHEEDAARGDLTYSRLVGVRGTFRSSAIFLLATAGGFVLFFLLQDSLISIIVFAACMFPSLIVFLFWWYAVVKDPKNADFTWMMRMNLIASSGMIVFLMLELSGLPRL